jgi:hypothetical protein
MAFLRSPVLGVRQQPNRDVVECRLVRHGVGDERRYAKRDFDQPARAFRRGVDSTHVYFRKRGYWRSYFRFRAEPKIARTGRLTAL